MDHVPAPHRRFVEHTVAVLGEDPRIVGIAAAGSWITGTMDAHSDVDLVAVVDRDAYWDVMNDRQHILARLGPLLCAVTGEHVGDPRLMVALYDAPLLHADVKFVSLDELAMRVEDLVVLWERDGALNQTLSRTSSKWPQPSWQWVEDRFWIWVHNGTTKIARGEIFEGLAFLSFLRSNALAPLGALRAGRNARGVRHVERDDPELAARLRETVATCDAASVRASLRAAIALYRELRASAPADLVRRSAAEAAAVAFFEAGE